MAIIPHPETVPYRVLFFLQPYNARSASPFTRKQKVLGLSRPLWVARLTYRTGYDGDEGVGAWGGAMDGWLAEMEGGANTTLLHDFRRPYPVGLRRYYREFAGQFYTFDQGETFRLGERFYVPAQAEPVNEAAEAGATTLTFGGFRPGERVFLTGDYVGGDGRPHIVLAPGAIAGVDGRATVRIAPPLALAIPAGGAITVEPPGAFKLVSDDAGANETEVGQLTEYSLDFIEDFA